MTDSILKSLDSQAFSNFMNIFLRYSSLWIMGGKCFVERPVASVYNPIELEYFIDRQEKHYRDFHKHLYYLCQHKDALIAVSLILCGRKRLRVISSGSPYFEEACFRMLMSPYINQVKERFLSFTGKSYIEYLNENMRRLRNH